MTSRRALFTEANMEAAVYSLLLISLHLCTLYKIIKIINSSQVQWSVESKSVFDDSAPHKLHLFFNSFFLYF